MAAHDAWCSTQTLGRNRNASTDAFVEKTTITHTMNVAVGSVATMKSSGAPSRMMWKLDEAHLGGRHPE